jgi:hypothetical protein
VILPGGAQQLALRWWASTVELKLLPLTSKKSACMLCALPLLLLLLLVVVVLRPAMCVFLSEFVAA